MAGDTQVIAILKQAKKLTSAQLGVLVELLMQCITDDPNYYADWHREEVRKAIAEMDANPDAWKTSEQSIASVREELDRRRASRK